VAANDFDGYDSVGAGYNWTSYDGESPKGMRAHGRGSFYVPLLGVFGLQLDGVYERNAYGSRDVTEHTGTVDIHVFARHQTGLIGVIAQGNYTTSTDGPADTAREHDSRYFIGDDGRTRQGRSVGLSFHVPRSWAIDHERILVVPIRAQLNDLSQLIAFQHRVYAENRAIIGVEPIPLMVDYHDIFPRMEFWIEGPASDPEGLAILDVQQDPTGADLYLWSIATSPQRRKCGIGNNLLVFVEHRARELKCSSISLSTNSLLTDRIDWYRRHGFSLTGRETMNDRIVVHMRKVLDH
jgi:GNAT superfamily N-acetyltransferase